MARPKKYRKVCFLPESNLFGPMGRKSPECHAIIMTVEEYETIRLIDLEGLMQEECADRMNVARTTVQRIYMEARKKIAHSLVDGVLLKIEGGDYQLCDQEEKIAGCGRCQRHRFNQKHPDNRQGGLLKNV